LADVDGLVLVDLGGIAGDDDEVLRVREIGNDVLGKPIREPLPSGILSGAVAEAERSLLRRKPPASLRRVEQG
jgi:hypothetical protein